jgi:hypothetical protein
MKMADEDPRTPRIERSLEVLRAGPANDPEVCRVRDSLAIRFRNLGQRDRAAALYADVRVCEHLEPLRQYLLEQRAAIVSAGQAWSRNCRLWMYFDVVLDVEALRARFALPGFVVVHIHRGTHDGAEQGLVCNAHHDGLMGGHPEVATAARVIG